MNENESDTNQLQEAAEHGAPDDGVVHGKGPAGEVDPSEADSSTFARCAACRNAAEVDRAAGTLLCTKHSMRVNAEADEIPDDCEEYEAGGGGE